MANIKLRSCDGFVFDLNAKLLPTSKKIQKMLESNNHELIPLPQIESEHVTKIIEWNAYKELDSIPEGDTLSEEQNKKIKERQHIWLTEFMNMKTSDLSRMLKVAKSLEMTELAADLSTVLVSRLKDLTEDEEVHQFFKDLE